MAVRKERRIPREPRRESASDPDDSVKLLDLALVLAARKRFIFLFSFCGRGADGDRGSDHARDVYRDNNHVASAAAGEFRHGDVRPVGWSGISAGARRWRGQAPLGLKNPDDLYIGLLQSNM